MQNNLHPPAATPTESPNASTDLRANKFLAKMCHTHLQALDRDGVNLVSALVATTDGFEIAAVNRKLQTAEKLAAMSCSLLALGNAVAAEVQSGECANLIIETKTGLILTMAIGDSRGELLLCLITGSGSTLGQALWAARACCRRIRTDSMAIL